MKDSILDSLDIVAITLMLLLIAYSISEVVYGY
jgi:hypothetical protein